MSHVEQSMSFGHIYIIAFGHPFLASRVCKDEFYSYVRIIWYQNQLLRHDRLQNYSGGILLS